MKETIEAIIFDMDGVLLDTEPVSKQAFEKAFASEKKDLSEEKYQEILGRSLNDISKVLSEKYQDPLIGNKIVKKRDQFFLDYFKEHDVIIKPGVCSFLEYCEKRNYKIAVATSASQTTAEYLLKQANIYDFFDAFSFGSEVEKAKPDPEIFLNAAKRLKVKPENTYVIEDAIAGIKGAQVGNFIPVFIPENQIVKDKPDEINQLVFQTMADFQLYMIESCFQ
ncbi:HAD family hydrolase [Enterococcus alishanensis]